MSEIVSQLTQISRFISQYRIRQTAPYGLNNRQASLLLEICATPGISQDTLSRRAFLDKSVVARLLANLEEQGYVDRPVSQKDRRVTCLYPTEKTLEILPRLQEILRNCEEYLTRGMTTEEMAAMQSMLCHLQNRTAEWEAEE